MPRRRARSEQAFHRRSAVARRGPASRLSEWSAVCDLDTTPAAANDACTLHGSAAGAAAPSPSQWALQARRANRQTASLIVSHGSSSERYAPDPEINDPLRPFESRWDQNLKYSLGSSPHLGKRERRKGFEPSTPSLGSPPGALERHHGVLA